MQHKKASHKENVNVCWNFSAGKCELGDDLCWFIHCNNSEETVIQEIKCNTCENVFNNINNFMQNNIGTSSKCVKTRIDVLIKIAVLTMTNTMNKMRNKMELLKTF